MLNKKPFYIGRAAVLKGGPYIIAEVGINHNGSYDRCIEMINVAKDSGADAVKFQTFRASELCGDPTQMFTYKSQGEMVTEPMLDMFKRNELDLNSWQKLKSYCDKLKIDFLSTPQNVSDLDELLKVGMSAIKVGSDDFTNLPLLREYSGKGLPMIISCGMSDIGEVHQALDAVGWYEDKVPVILLLCTSQYPTPKEDVNINKLITLRAAFEGLNLGFSDHTSGVTAAIMATTLGATLFEKHFTLSHDLPGPDHWFSEEPNELSQWVAGIKEASCMLGSRLVIPTAPEKDMRVLARRSVVALKDINCGERFTSLNIGARRPGGGLSSDMIEKITELKANKNIPAGSLIELKDLTDV